MPDAAAVPDAAVPDAAAPDAAAAPIAGPSAAPLVRLPRTRDLPILAKILVGFFFAVVPMYLISLFLYLNGADAVRGRILEAERVQTRSSLVSIEREIDRMLSVQRQYAETYRLLKIGLSSEIMNDWEIVEAILDIQSDLTLLCNASPFVADAWILLPGLGSAITRSDVIKDPDLSGYAVPDKPGVRFTSQGVSLEYPYPSNFQSAGLQFSIHILLSEQSLSAFLTNAVRLPSGYAFLFQGRELLAMRSDAPQAYRDAAAAQVARIAAPAAAPDSPRIAYPDAGDGQDPFAISQSAIRIDGRPLIATLASSAEFGITVVFLGPEDDALGPLADLRFWFWFLTVLTLLLVVLFAWWISSSIERPLSVLLNGLRRVERGDMDVRLTQDRKDEFGYLHRRFDSMVLGIKETLKQCAEQGDLARRAELRQLQYQINPHFLYNSIYHIYRMARAEDYENIEKYALHLGSYFQFITKSGTGPRPDETTLAEEVEHGRNYLAVQRTRFSDRIAVEIASLPESLAKLRVPKLIIQPLLENAYNHGLKDTQRDGLVRLRFEDAGTAALILVEDSGPSGTDHGSGSGADSPDGLDRTVAELSQNLKNADLAGDGESSGLRNIHRRLHLRFGAFSGLRFDRSDLGGLKVSILIPMEGAPHV